MINTHHEKVLKALTSKGAESPTNDADKDENENGSSSGSKDLNFGEDEHQIGLQDVTSTLDTRLEVEGKRFTMIVNLSYQDVRYEMRQCKSWMCTCRASDKDRNLYEAEIGESKMIRLELEQETTKVVVIKERLRKPKIIKRVKLIVEMKLLGFSVGDHVMMKSHLEGVSAF
ncbi:hypothetical protein Tco_0128689 [Tanacetum coccineum]